MITFMCKSYVWVKRFQSTLALLSFTWRSKCWLHTDLSMQNDWPLAVVPICWMYQMYLLFCSGTLHVYQYIILSTGSYEYKYAGWLSTFKVQKHRFIIISLKINNLSLQIAFSLLLLQTKPPAHNFHIVWSDTKVHVRTV